MRPSNVMSVLVLGLAACTVHVANQPQSTAGLALNQISLDQSVQSYEDGKVSIYATPYTTSAELLTLDANDNFQTSLSGAPTTPLVHDGNHYSASLTTASSAPVDVTISFLHTGAEAHSTVTLPAAPKVASAPATLDQGQDLVIDLTDAPPQGARVTLRLLDVQTLFGDVSPTCLQLNDPVLNATRVEGTRVTLSSATLFARDPAKKDAPQKACDVKIGVRFETNGTRDPALGGGGISGLMERPAYATGGVHMTRTDL
jgi:hypothetical protein